jgi:hypothetical protein
MEITFRTRLIPNREEGCLDEEYTVVVSTNGMTTEISVTDDDITYEEFKADILQDVLEGVLMRQGEECLIYEDDIEVDYDFELDESFDVWGRELGEDELRFGFTIFNPNEDLEEDDEDDDYGGETCGC